MSLLDACWEALGRSFEKQVEEEEQKRLLAVFAEGLRYAQLDDPHRKSPAQAAKSVSEAVHLASDAAKTPSKTENFLNSILSVPLYIEPSVHTPSISDIIISIFYHLLVY